MLGGNITMVLRFFLIIAWIVVIILCFSIMAWIVVKISYFIRIVILVNRIPGPPALPIIGNAHQFEKEPHDFYMRFKKYYETFPSIYRLWIGPVPAVTLCSPESAEVILSSRKKHISKAHFYTFFKTWLGDGLLLSTGKKWEDRRKLITPTFHFEILNDFLCVFNEQSNILADKLDAATNQKCIDICPLVCGCVLDALCETAMGHCLGSQNNAENDYAKAVKRLAEILQELFKKPMYWIPGFFKRTQAGKEYHACLDIVHGLTSRVIRSRLEVLQKSGLDQEFNGNLGESQEERPVFLDVLLRSHLDNPEFTFDDIREEVDTFMFEGHDTTFSALSWAINIIGNHPGAQAQIHKELDDIFGNDDRPATKEDLSKMNYLERVIKECLRMKPPVTAIGRQLDEDTMIDGYLVPKNVFLMISLDAIHHNPKHWKDPDKFDPDRFLPENAAVRRKYAYVPFSAGRRNCIGQRFGMMKIKVILSTLYRRFHLKSLQNGDRETRPVSELVVRPQNGLHINVTRRSR
ncbi:cytochrome P450 4C1-like [Anneissia japonica]|uniref:cytochrome P450 4C1-like n=1 Tax=Anneissia japonica TaxID=1529436 RepID=UPI001425AEDF|nr:cytochrome P450 4C1-like [Anneissia japonica]